MIVSGFVNLPVRPGPNGVRRRELDADRVEVRRLARVGHLDHVALPYSVRSSATGYSHDVGFAGPAESASQLVGFRYHAVLQNHVEAKTLKLLDQHVEGLWNARLGRVFALDDRLVDARPTGGRRPTSRLAFPARYMPTHMPQGPIPPFLRSAGRRTAPCRPGAAG